MKDESLISNYYDILNVLPKASLAEIKKKFKQTALKTHPDKNNNPQSKLKIQELNEAKRILTDENFLLRKIKWVMIVYLLPKIFQKIRKFLNFFKKMKKLRIKKINKFY